MIVLKASSMNSQTLHGVSSVPCQPRNTSCLLNPTRFPSSFIPSQQITLHQKYLQSCSRASNQSLLPHVQRLSSPRDARFRVHAQASPVGLVQLVTQPFHVSPPTWGSSVQAMLVVFIIGSPLLLAGLTAPAVGAAFLLGAVTWRAFSADGLAIVIVYYLLGSAVTRVRQKQKEAEGIAEKRSGRRGPGSVWGSGAAGLACALVATLEDRNVPLALLRLGFVASFCTKLSDTSASEIGKAFGRTTYLATSFAPVPRGTEGAVSVEGTLAGVCAAILLAALAVGIHLVDMRGALLCLVASQVANYGESLLGATLQGRPGYEWLNNDVVNVLNITLGAFLAMALAVVT